MTPQTRPVLVTGPSSPPGPSPPVVSAKPTQNRLAFAARLAVTALLLIVYFTLSGKIIGLLGGETAAVAPRVIAVTLLGVLLACVWWQLLKSDPRFYAPILITYILALGDISFGILETHHSELLSRMTDGRITTYNPTFLAIVATCVLELILSRFLTGKWPHLASAYISGISVGILIKSPELWPFILCGLISITSKYVLRVSGRHLWNPTNFGVCLMLLLAAKQVAVLSVQSGNEWWPVLLIWVLGSLILYRFKLLHIPLVFVAAFIPLSFLRSPYTGNTWQTEIAPMTSTMFQLYIFFMITDPKTITKTRGRQCLVALIIAILETVLRLVFRDIYSLLHALFIAGPAANLIEIWWTKKRLTEALVK
jgi:hypothetical protein